MAPTPALLVRSEGGTPLVLVNRAANAAAFASTWTPDDWARIGMAVLASVEAAPEGWADGRDPGSGLAWRAVSWLASGWLAWLDATQVACAPPWRETVKLAEQLAIVQEFGQLGIWERDAVSGHGRWDRQCFRLFGLTDDARADGAQAPGFDAASALIHPDDRERVALLYQSSLQQPGRYETHFRVPHPSGELKRLRSTWRVESASADRPARAIGILVDDTEQLAALQRHAVALQQLSLAGGLVGITLWRVDVATQQVHFDTVGEAFGTLEATSQGMSVDKVRAGIHPEDREAVRHAATLALTSDGAVDLRVRFRDREGRYRELMTRRIAERDERGEVVALIGASMDMTEQVAERARGDAISARMQLVAEGTGIGVWSYDFDSQERHWNGCMRQLFGVAEGETPPGLRRSLEGVVVPEDRQRVLSMVRRIERASAQAAGQTSADAPDPAEAPAMGEVVEVEFRIQRADGTLRWLVTRTQVLRQGPQTIAHGVMIDVTDFRATQVELKLANRRVELAAQAAGLGTWQLDIDTGAIHWDSQMYRLRGLSPDDPRPPLELIRSLPPAGEDPGVHAKVEASLAGGEAYSNEFRVCWPDGSVRWLASRGMTAADPDAKVGHMFGINWDITEQKHAEQMQRDKLMAEEASRAKSEFLARMSHELRTPLNAVLGFAELLCAALPERIGSEERAHAMLIRSAGRHLLALIDDVLDLARIDAARVPLANEPVSLDVVLSDVVRWIQTEARAAAVTVRADASAAWVRADAKSLRQVFLNLLSNGVKYNRAGGVVQVRVGPVGASTTCIRVINTGRGMSDQQLAHLFEPFNRLGAEGGQVEGTGIGLAIVHQLVQRMNGRIEVHSEPGQGAEFSLWLPSAGPVTVSDGHADRMLAPLPAHGAEASSPLPPRVALYIEDNPVNLLLVRELFNRKPAWTLHDAVDGTQGIARALKLRPQLVLIDMQLPDMGGADVLARLRAEPGFEGICCIALSANAMPADVAQARAQGFDDYWTKPIDFDAFLNALDRLALTNAAPL